VNGLLQTAQFTGTGTSIGNSAATVVTGGGNVTGGAGRTVIVTGSGWIENANGSPSNFTVTLLVGGSIVDTMELSIGANPEAGAFSLTFQVAIAAGGNHAVDLQILGPGSGGTAENCSLIAMVVNV